MCRGSVSAIRAAEGGTECLRRSFTTVKETKKRKIVSKVALVQTSHHALQETYSLDDACCEIEGCVIFHFFFREVGSSNMGA